jgi:DNA repair protein RadA/Sms
VALVPADSGAAPPGMRLVEVPDLGTAFQRLF